MSDQRIDMRPTVDDEINAAWAEVNKARAERDRAVEQRENANAVSVRVEVENRRLREALEQLRHLVVSPGDMGREEIRDAGRRVIKEALNGS